MKTLRVQNGSASSNDDERFARIEQSVDAIALEVERIPEGQRFTTKLLSENAGLTEAGAATTVEQHTST